MAGPRRAAAPYDAREARRLDLNAEELGVPVARLMGNAGRALADEVARHTKPGDQVLLLCGKGNNGGDGFAAAARLLELRRVPRVVLAEPASRIQGEAARAHLARLPRAMVSTWTGRPDPAWSKVPALVDCLLGSGLQGEPRKPYSALVAWLDARRKAGRTVIACDVPSGWPSAKALRPTVTVAMHAAHSSLKKASGGRIRVAPIGMPAAARHIGFGDAVLGYPPPAAASHKGDNGTVLAVAGSLPLAGAPHYVALGAYRAGADLVHVAAPAHAAATMRAWGPDALVHGVPGLRHLTPEALPAIDRLLGRCKAVVVGPGLGPHPSTLAASGLVLDAAADRGIPVVVDADGLDAVEPDLLRRHGARMVLTPHAREFEDLAGKAATRANVERFAREHGVTVLRKGAVDVVSDGVTTRECHRGHPTMTVGGTGDVLAGITAALLSKGAAAFEAACAASYLAKAAGEVAASVRSHGATAVDVAEAVPAVLARIEARRQAKA